MPPLQCIASPSRQGPNTLEGNARGDVHDIDGRTKTVAEVRRAPSFFASYHPAAGAGRDVFYYIHSKVLD